MYVSIAIISAVMLIILFNSATNLSLRNVSFSRLAQTLSDRRAHDWLEIYRHSMDRFLLATAVIRMAGMLGLVLISFHILRAEDAHSIKHYVQVFLLSAVLASVFGVAIPQALAKYIGERVLAARVTLGLLQFTTWLTSPVILVLQLFEELVRRLAGAPRRDIQVETEQIEQEVLHAVSEAELQGAVDEEERQMIKSVMALDEDTVDHIMTPRTELVAVNKDITLDQLKTVIKEEGHSRIPVYDGDIDHVLGMVYAKDLLQVSDNGSFDITQVLRTVPFVPETKPLRELLKEFRTERIHAAIVLDEYGGTAGLATFEDILEELVGEITDEYEQPEPEPIVHVSERVVEVDSKVHVDQLNDQLHLQIPECDDYETVGGFVFSTLGRIPPIGEELIVDRLKITILDAEDRRVNRLRLELLPQEVQP